MSSDVSAALSSALTYRNMDLSVFPLAPKDEEAQKHFKWEPFQHKLSNHKHIKYLYLNRREVAKARE